MLTCCGVRPINSKKQTLTSKQRTDAVGLLKSFFNATVDDGFIQTLPNISDFKSMHCVCGCGSRVTGTQVVCPGCQRILSTSCKAKRKDVSEISLIFCNNELTSFIKGLCRECGVKNGITGSTDGESSSSDVSSDSARAIEMRLTNLLSQVIAEY